MKTAEEILKEKFENSFLDLDYIDLHLEAMIEFAKMHVSESGSKIKEAKDNFPKIGFDEEFIRGFNKAMQMAVFILERNNIQ